MTNISERLNNTLTSLFIEDQSWALEARLFDYEREKQKNWKTKVSLEKLRIDLERKQKEIIDFAIDFDPSLENIWINQEYIWKSIKINSVNKYILTWLIKQLMPFMIKEEIDRFYKLSEFQIYLTFYRKEKNWPILIKKVELVDLNKNNDKENSKKWWNDYFIEIS